LEKNWNADTKSELRKQFGGQRDDRSRVLAGPSRATAGPRETFSPAPQTLSPGLSGEKIVVFFQNDTFWRTLYFWPTAGPQTSRGPG